MAIIGPSGSGKSTLLQILSGLYDIPHGDVKLYGQRVTDISEEARYSELNVLLQAQQLFDGTIRENLFSEEKDDKLLQVLEEVNLGHLKLDQQLTLDGHTLSGGEIQRLALARLLLKKRMCGY